MATATFTLAPAYQGLASNGQPKFRGAVVLVNGVEVDAKALLDAGGGSIITSDPDLILALDSLDAFSASFAAPPPGATQEDAVVVAVTSLQAGDAITWDGDQWVNTTPVRTTTGPLTSTQAGGLLTVGQTLFELDAGGNVVAEWVKVP